MLKEIRDLASLIRRCEHDNIPQIRRAVFLDVSTGDKAAHAMCDEVYLAGALSGEGSEWGLEVSRDT